MDKFRKRVCQVFKLFTEKDYDTAAMI